MRHSRETGSVAVTVVVGVLMFVAGAAVMYLWLEMRPGAGSRPTMAVASPSPSPFAAPPLAEPSTPAPGTSSPAVEVVVAGPPPTQVASGPEAPASVPRGSRPSRPAVTSTRPDATAPAPPPAPAPAPAAVPLPPPAPGGFFLGRTEVASLKSVRAQLEGFDIAGVDVKRAPTVTGRLELEVEPFPERAGDPYAVRVYLRNEGKKPIQVDSMKVSMIVDGKATTRPLPPKVRAVRPRERTLLEELPGVWTGTPRSWAVEVEVTSKGQDVYRNRLIWQ